MDAVIMAGGKGTRFLPFTKHRPKPMVPFLNKPVMEYMVGKLKDAGIDRIIVLLGYLSDHVIEHFEEGSRFGVEMEYIDNNQPYGTAGAVKRAVERIDDTFMVVSSDTITEISLRKFMKFYGDRGGRINIALSRFEKPYQYGIALVDEEDRIYKFLEKPKKGEVFSNLVNTGIYIFEPDIFDLVPPRTEFDFSNDLFPLLLKRSEPILGYKFSEYWADIGTPKRYLKATRDALIGRLDKDRIGGDWWIADENGLVMGRDCSLEDSVEIDGFAVLGDNVNIDDNASLSNSVIWPNTDIGGEVTIRDSIIGENVTIDSHVDLGKGSMISDNQCVLK